MLEKVRHWCRRTIALKLLAAAQAFAGFPRMCRGAKTEDEYGIEENLLVLEKILRKKSRSILSIFFEFVVEGVAM